MKQNYLPLLKLYLRAGVLVWAAAAPLCNAATLWTGPNTTWTKSGATPSDPVLPGVVVLTRDSSQVLYNTAAGETFAGSTNSPLDTTWAFGTIDNFSTLTYQSLDWYREFQAGGNMSLFITNKPMVMHIVSQDIYLSVKFIVWGHSFTPSAGAVTYVRSTPSAGGNPPTVSITSPTNGATFAAPADVGIAADATVIGGTVTNVSFFNNTTLLGSSQTFPFSITASNLAAGAYALKAVATAAGVSGTSSVVNITIVSPAAFSILTPGISNGLFSFTYNADAGKSYVVQTSSNLVDWVPLVTNVAASSPVLFSDPVAVGPALFYRVGRLPGP